MATHTTAVHAKIGDHAKFLINDSSDLFTSTISNIHHHPSPLPHTSAWDGDANLLPIAPTSEQSAMEEMDELIGSQIQLQTNNGPEVLKVITRKRDSSGKLIGKHAPNKAEDTQLYMVEYPDGHFGEYSSNILIEALSDQYDYDGCDKNAIKEICGYCSDSNAVTKEHVFFDLIMVTKFLLSRVKDGG